MPPRGEVHVLETPQALAQAVADVFVSRAQDAIDARGEFFVALAGGTTPKGSYQLLAREPRRSAVAWDRVRIFFGDERSVGPDDDDSNYKMTREAFLDAVVPPHNVYRVRGEDDPVQAAADYAAVLLNLMGLEPRFDLIMLGMGADGHTASLFPGADPRTDDERLVREVWVEEKQTYRITLTPSVINAARHVLIATEGESKAAILREVLEGPHDPVARPVQIVAPSNGTLDWYVDRAAAAQLTPDTMQ